MKSIFNPGYILISLVCIVLFSHCKTQTGPGKKGSDKKAIELAQKVIAASGGKENLDKIRYLSFDYFGRRHWIWDKVHGRYRMESMQRNIIAAGTFDGSDTYVYFNRKILTNGDSLAKIKSLVNEMFINDTYWLLFPFKLLDPGVNLKYLGECTTDSMQKATCIELTFDSVGLTPGNRYVAYIDEAQNDVIWWDYYENAEDEKPTLSNPWTRYKPFGDVRFAEGRGFSSIGDIKLFEDLPIVIFTDVTMPHQALLKKAGYPGY